MEVDAVDVDAVDVDATAQELTVPTTSSNKKIALRLGRCAFSALAGRRPGVVPIKLVIVLVSLLRLILASIFFVILVSVEGSHTLPRSIG